MASTRSDKPKIKQVSKLKTIFYTGKGDSGASIISGRKIPKSDAVFELLGNLDELNSLMGLSRVYARNRRFASIDRALLRLQEFTFIVQAEIAAIAFNYPKTKKISGLHTEYLEAEIKKIDEKLPALAHFIISGEGELAAWLDLARAVSRRVERSAVAVSKKVKLSADLLRLLNRLSSMLFAQARHANFLDGKKERRPEYR